MRTAAIRHFFVRLLVLALSIGAGCRGPEGTGGRLSVGLGAFSVSSIPDPNLGKLAACELTLTAAPDAGPGDGAALEVRAGHAADLRAAYFRVTYDPARYTWLSATAGPGLRDVAPRGQLLELYVQSAPGAVDCGQVLPGWDKRRGLSGSARLATLYFARRSTPDSLKAACQPPDLDRSKATLTFNGSNILQWRFYSQGDCDQNGVVGVTDLMPLGRFYGQAITYPGEVDTAKAAADCNADGVILVADVAPIGINFGKNLLNGWNVYASPNTSDYPVHWDDNNGPGANWLGNVPRTAYDASTTPANDRLLYMCSIPAPCRATSTGCARLTAIM